MLCILYFEMIRFVPFCKIHKVLEKVLEFGLVHLHKVKASRLALHHKPLTTLGDKFRASAKNILGWFWCFIYIHQSCHLTRFFYVLAASRKDCGIVPVCFIFICFMSYTIHLHVLFTQDVQRMTFRCIYKNLQLKPCAFVYSLTDLWTRLVEIFGIASNQNKRGQLEIYQLMLSSVCDAKLDIKLWLCEDAASPGKTMENDFVQWVKVLEFFFYNVFMVYSTKHFSLNISLIAFMLASHKCKKKCYGMCWLHHHFDVRLNGARTVAQSGL